MASGQRKQVSHEEVEETKRTILRTAHQLFMEQGYRAVTTRQIADACGLTQPALYHYFSDKQDLYVAVMLGDLAKTKVALERVAHREEGVEERLRQVVRYLLGTTHHDMSMMMHDIRQELSSQAQQTLTDAFRTSMLAPIASIIGDGVQEGIVRDQEHGGVDAMTAAFLFMNMLTRFIIRPTEIATQLATKQGERAEIVVDILLHGIAYARVGEQKADLQ